MYVLDDGEAFKIGYTNGYVAARVADLQTGNQRLIRTVAEVGSASPAVEKHLQPSSIKGPAGRVVRAGPARGAGSRRRRLGGVVAPAAAAATARRLEHPREPLETPGC